MKHPETLGGEIAEPRRMNRNAYAGDRAVNRGHDRITP
jgi:hypothetical protein